MRRNARKVSVFITSLITRTLQTRMWTTNYNHTKKKKSNTNLWTANSHSGFVSNNDFWTVCPSVKDWRVKKKKKKKYKYIISTFRLRCEAKAFYIKERTVSGRQSRSPVQKAQEVQQYSEQRQWRESLDTMEHQTQVRSIIEVSWRTVSEEWSTGLTQCVADFTGL